MSVVYCSQPRPLKTEWQYENQRVNEASRRTKYKSSIKTLAREGCYEAKLLVLNLRDNDAGRYKFWVTNEKGSNAMAVTLRVRGLFYPTFASSTTYSICDTRIVLTDRQNMALVLGIVVAAVFVIIVVLIGVIRCYQGKMLCFARKPVLFLPHQPR